MYFFLQRITLRFRKIVQYNIKNIKYNTILKKNYIKRIVLLKVLTQQQQGAKKQLKQNSKPLEYETKKEDPHLWRKGVHMDLWKQKC